jgi:hypothetical protein
MAGSSDFHGKPLFTDRAMVPFNVLIDNAELRIDQIH